MSKRLRLVLFTFVALALGDSRSPSHAAGFRVEVVRPGYHPEIRRTVHPVRKFPLIGTVPRPALKRLTPLTVERFRSFHGGLREPKGLPEFHPRRSSKTQVGDLSGRLLTDWKEQGLVPRIYDLKNPKTGVAHPTLVFEPPASPGPSREAEALTRFSLWTDVRSAHVADTIGLSERQDLDPRGPGQDLSPLAKHLRDELKVSDFETVSDSFSQETFTRAGTLAEPTTLLRLFDEDPANPNPSKALGRFYLCCIGDGLIDARGLATPPGNLKRDLAAVTIPAGTKVVVGTIANQNAFKALGGNIQIFISEVKDFPYERFKSKTSSSVPIKPSDVLIQSDRGRIVRFHRNLDKDTPSNQRSPGRVLLTPVCCATPR